MGALCLSARHSNSSSSTAYDSSLDKPVKHFNSPVAKHFDSPAAKHLGSNYLSKSQVGPDHQSHSEQTFSSCYSGGDKSANSAFNCNPKVSQMMRETKFPVITTMRKEGAVFTAMQVEPGNSCDFTPQNASNAKGSLVFLPVDSSGEFERKDVISCVPTRRSFKNDDFSDERGRNLKERIPKFPTGIRDFKNRQRILEDPGVDSVQGENCTVYECGPPNDNSPPSQERIDSRIVKSIESKETRRNTQINHVTALKQEKHAKDIPCISPLSQNGSIHSISGCKHVPSKHPGAYNEFSNSYIHPSSVTRITGGKIFPSVISSKGPRRVSSSLGDTIPVQRTYPSRVDHHRSANASTLSSNQQSVRQSSNSVPVSDYSDNSLETIPVAKIRVSRTPPGTDTETSDSESLHRMARDFESSIMKPNRSSGLRNMPMAPDNHRNQFLRGEKSIPNSNSADLDFLPITPRSEVIQVSHPQQVVYATSVGDRDLLLADAVEFQAYPDDPDSDKSLEIAEALPINEPVYVHEPENELYPPGSHQSEWHDQQLAEAIPLSPKSTFPQAEPTYPSAESLNDQGSVQAHSPAHSSRNEPSTTVGDSDLYAPVKKKASRFGWLTSPKISRANMEMLTANILQRSSGNILEHYEVFEDELGRGRFGIIHVCACRKTGQRLACKSIRKKKLECEQDVEDVRREVQVMHMLRGHPHIVHLKDTFEDSKFVHLVMELCEGGELFDRIKKRHYYCEKNAARVIKTVVEVLKYCHSLGIMHRDLKPENILLCNYDSDTTLKVIDYGVALFFRKGKYATDIAGSPFYLAPEVLKQKYGPEADIWSAGVVLYILLCGVPPFWANTNDGIFDAIKKGKINMTREPWSTISDNAKHLVTSMLIKDPKRRISIDEILAHPWLNQFSL